ncbi:hypothetical protein DFP72DRAFT_851525 [Ephemerocybe angulata]|uniref:Uncharacterized protein n=1 Tax=Ephemerocybe angulata TaxID=980116 RepID=A0A8H6M2E6_9AGAR|nr:hypothetical protein DFP72DRAFT_851525 [Tulosesus angulatus]
MSFQATSSSLFGMDPRNPEYIACVEACAEHESTLVNDKAYQSKIGAQTLLADPCVLPVEDHVQGGLCAHLVFCIPCNTGVKLSTRGATSVWDRHACSKNHEENVERYEALHGPLERVVKSAMPRYRAVSITDIGNHTRLVVQMYVPTQGDMFSEHNDLIPITLA